MNIYRSIILNQSNILKQQSNYIITTSFNRSIFNNSIFNNSIRFVGNNTQMINKSITNNDTQMINKFITNNDTKMLNKSITNNDTTKMLNKSITNNDTTKMLNKFTSIEMYIYFLNLGVLLLLYNLPFSMPIKMLILYIIFLYISFL
jgi:transcriptional regulator CtsR